MKKQRVPAYQSFSKTELRKLAKLTKEPGGKTFGSMEALLRDRKSKNLGHKT